MCVCKIQLNVHYTPTSINGSSVALSRHDFNKFYNVCRDFGASMDSASLKLTYYPELTLLRRVSFSEHVE